MYIGQSIAINAKYIVFSCVSQVKLSQFQNIIHIIPVRYVVGGQIGTKWFCFLPLIIDMYCDKPTTTVPLYDILKSTALWHYYVCVIEHSTMGALIKCVWYGIVM